MRVVFSILVVLFTRVKMNYSRFTIDVLFKSYATIKKAAEFTGGNGCYLLQKVWNSIVYSIPPKGLALFITYQARTATDVPIIRSNGCLNYSYNVLIYSHRGTFIRLRCTLLSTRSALSAMLTALSPRIAFDLSLTC